MDFSISLVTPAMHRARGAQAFDEGRGIDSHGMNPWAPAVADFRKGWQQRQAESAVEQLLILAIAMECPP